jgi:hypothetical protein
MSGDPRIREAAMLLGEAHPLDMSIVAKPVRAAELRQLLADCRTVSARAPA